MDDISKKIPFVGRQTLAATFVDGVFRAAEIFDIPSKSIKFSKSELASALQEADLDITFMLLRRQPAHGISPGKIAGAVAFRLSRSRILHFEDPSREHESISQVQEYGALFTVQRRILAKSIPRKRFMEVAYQLAKRHTNPEHLGLVFDVLLDK